MAHRKLDRVAGTTRTTGVGALLLDGAAIAGYSRWQDVLNDGDTAYAMIVDRTTKKREGALVTYSGGTLTRTTLLSSTTGSSIDFPAGTKEIFLYDPAAKSVVVAPDESVSLPGALSILGALAIAGAAVFSGALTATGAITGAADIRAGAASAIGFTGRSQFQSGADGNVTVSNAAATDFGLFRFGGGTSSFPALKRSGTTLAHRLADDSADAPMSASNGTFSGNVGAASGSITGALGIGAAAAAATRLNINGTISGATTSYSTLHTGTIQSGVTSSAYYNSTQAATAAASFTLGSLYHFSAGQGTFGSGSAVTSQYGFIVQASLTGATNNYGYYANLAAGTGRWNFRAEGDAQNFFRGLTGFGITTPLAQVHVAGAKSSASWTTRGLQFATDAATLTDTTGSGTISPRAANSFGIPTFASTGTVTLSNAATLFVAGAPIAGTNTTISSPWSLMVAAGKSLFSGGVLVSATGASVVTGASQAALRVENKTSSTAISGNLNGGILSASLDTPSSNVGGGFYVGGVLSSSATSNDGGTSTTLTAPAAGAATALTVASISGFLDTNNIWVLLDSGVWFPTKISGTPSGTTLNIFPALPSGVSSGRTVYGYKGSVQGGIANGILASGATKMNENVGFEASLSTRAGSSVFQKFVLSVVANADDVVAADGPWDACIGITRQDGSVGQTTGIAFGSWAGSFPIVSSGTLIRTFNGATYANGIDLSGDTISGYAWQSPGCTLDGSGNLKALSYKVGANQVVGARSTGWTAQTATPSKVDLGASPTVGAIAQWAAAVQTALATHGLFNA